MRDRDGWREVEQPPQALHGMAVRGWSLASPPGLHGKKQKNILSHEGLCFLLSPAVLSAGTAPALLPETPRYPSSCLPSSHLDLTRDMSWGSTGLKPRSSLALVRSALNVFKILIAPDSG